MVGSNGTMIAIRLVRSKLRKREDHHGNGNGAGGQPTVVQQPTEVQVQCPVVVSALGAADGIVNPAMSTSTSSVDSCCGPNHNSHNNHNNHNHNHNLNLSSQHLQAQIVHPGKLVQESNRSVVGCCSPADTGSTVVYTTTASANPADQFIWQFPPPYPPPNTPPPQYTLYNDQDTLVHGLQSDRQGFAKGFRKNLGGRWRRLVKRKPESEMCAIPPELKDQLKTIYVY